MAQPSHPTEGAASTAEGSAAPASVSPTAPEPVRRNVLVSMLALAVGAFISLVPFTAGLFVFLDPVLKKRAKGAATGEMRRVCSLETLPVSGEPVKVALIADRVDAWTVDPNQPIGAVYLHRTTAKDGGVQVKAFNAICPHAGCFVGWLPGEQVYLCPCHNSAFLPDGEKTNFKGKTNPSPRPMDSLEAEVRDGDVWVKFQNFLVGLHEKQVK